LRGHAAADFYRIQVEFVDMHSSEVLFNEVYRIRPEGGEVAAPAGSDSLPPPAPADQAPQTPTATVPGVEQPTTTSPSGNGNL